jgi:uncharacterized protein YkwD
MRILAWAGALAVVVTLGAAAVPAYFDQRPASPELQITASGFGLAIPQGLLPTPAAAASPAPSTTPTPKKPAPAKTSPAAPSKPARNQPSIVVRSTQQSLINQDRARYHLAPLTWSSCLYNIARYEAAHLAQPGVTFKHYDGVSRDLGCHLGRQVGENIGWYSGGINDSKLNSMFMASPDHKANILGPYHYVATAWAVRSDGTAFIAVEFG